MKTATTSSGTYYLFNKKDQKTPIVFVHGVGLTHEIWHPQLNFFKEYTTLTYDILGHGKSTLNKEIISFNDFSDQIGTNLLAVTQGSSGVKLNIQDSKEVIHCPAFASTVVDKVGSGDAMLAILSLAMLKNLEPDSALFLSSLAAVQSVETFGNKESISKVKLIKTMEHVLK